MDFTDIVSVKRPLVLDEKIVDPYWLAGFTSAEGSFMVKIFKSNASKMGVTVRLVFQLSQHQRDEQLMKSFIYYLDCGNVHRDRNYLKFEVTNINDICDKIIPFFKKYPIQGVKSEDFQDFCKVAELMKSKKHLTTLGLEQIRKIKAGMNKGRK